MFVPFSAITSSKIVWKSTQIKTSNPFLNIIIWTFLFTTQLLRDLWTNKRKNGLKKAGRAHSISWYWYRPVTSWHGFDLIIWFINHALAHFVSFIHLFSLLLFFSQSGGPCNCWPLTASMVAQKKQRWVSSECQLCCSMAPAATAPSSSSLFSTITLCLHFSFVCLFSRVHHHLSWWPWWLRCRLRQCVCMCRWAIDSLSG